MNPNSHLYVALSGHGFGHLAQVAPVLNEWRRRWPEARLTLQSVLPEAVLRERIAGEFAVVVGAADFGMLMVDALEAKVAESLAAYRTFHAEWDARLAWQEGLLREAAPDLVLADIPYLSLAAAARLDIPTLALCSLNWADILAGYCPDEPDLQVLRAPMLAAYHSAVAFLQPAPSMPMPDLRNARPIGPIAALGRDRRPEIDRRLGFARGRNAGVDGTGWRGHAPAAGNLAGISGGALADAAGLERDAAGYDELGGCCADCSMLDSDLLQRRAVHQTRLWRVRRGGLQWNAGALRRARRLAGGAVAEPLAGRARQRRQDQPPATGDWRSGRTPAGVAGPAGPAAAAADRRGRGRRTGWNGCSVNSMPADRRGGSPAC